MNAARIRALAVVSTLMIATLVLVYFTMHRDSQTHASYASGCPAGTIAIVTSPLPTTNTITIKVWNGSKRVGLADQVADDFRHRGFTVEKVGRHDNKPTTDVVASISYGPQTVGAAWVVRAYFLMTDMSTDSNMHFDLKRKSAVIDVVLGKGFRQLGAPTEVNQAIAALGTPTAPKGTCAKNPA